MSLPPRIPDRANTTPELYCRLNERGVLVRAERREPLVVFRPSLAA